MSGKTRNTEPPIRNSMNARRAAKTQRTRWPTRTPRVSKNQDPTTVARLDLLNSKVILARSPSHRRKTLEVKTRKEKTRIRFRRKANCPRTGTGASRVSRTTAPNSVAVREGFSKRLIFMTLSVSLHTRIYYYLSDGDPNRESAEDNG